MLGNTANTDSYKLGKDEIMSVKTVVGKRDVSKEKQGLPAAALNLAFGRLGFKPFSALRGKEWL